MIENPIYLAYLQARIHQSQEIRAQATHLLFLQLSCFESKAGAKNQLAFSPEFSDLSSTLMNRCVPQSLNFCLLSHFPSLNNLPLKPLQELLQRSFQRSRLAIPTSLKAIIKFRTNSPWSLSPFFFKHIYHYWVEKLSFVFPSIPLFFLRSWNLSPLRFSWTDLSSFPCLHYYFTSLYIHP